MPTEQRYRFVIPALKALLFLFFSVTVSFSSAAGLGRLTVLSSLGQPLRAEVELTSVSPDEAPSLAASLAPSEAYKRSGIDYTPLLQTLRLSVEKEGERYFISIRSTQPVNEPYIGVLLELSTGSERKGREYAITLDPAEWTNLRSAPLSSAASRQRLSQQQRAAKQSSRALPATAVRPVSVMPDKEVRASTEYVVSRGESLSGIAGRLGERHMSLEQMLVALYRHNPDAFLNNNMNLLREGAVLSIPQGADASGVSPRHARRIVRLHAANFRGYSQRLAGMVQKSAPRDTVTGPVAEGKVSVKVKEQPSPVSRMPDRLELSKARQDAAPAGMTEEEKNAMNRAIEDANRRITELEKNVSELRSLLEVVSRNGNALTKPAEKASGQGETPEKQPAEKMPAGTETGSPQTATGIIENTPSSATAASPEDKKDGATDQTLAKAGQKTETPDKKDGKDDEGDEGDEDEEVKKKPGFLSGPVLSVAAGVTLALLVLIVLLWRMRRRKPATPASAPAPAPAAKSAADEEEKYVNPNIILGRDFLDNISGRDVLDEDTDEDADDDGDAYRPMRGERDEDTDEDDAGDDPRIRHEDDDVPGEIAQASGEDDESEETGAASGEAVSVPEADALEGIAPEPEEVPEEGGIAGEPVFESADAADDGDDVALALDEEDASAEDAIMPEEEDEDDPAPLELDLSDISLEPDVAEAAEEDLPDMASPAAAENPEPYNAEMAAKLELAQAYLDMKDKEGARELLEEVLERGTPKQIGEAEQLLQLL